MHPAVHADVLLLPKKFFKLAGREREVVVVACRYATARDGGCDDDEEDSSRVRGPR